MNTAMNSLMPYLEANQSVQRVPKMMTQLRTVGRELSRGLERCEIVGNSKGNSIGNSVENIIGNSTLCYDYNRQMQVCRIIAIVSNTYSKFTE